MRTASTSAHLDTPVRSEDARPEQVTVTDPAHPLYGRRFVLAPVSGVKTGGQVLVVFRDDVLLRVPVAATDLSPARPCLPTSKLSLAAIRDLICLALPDRPASQPVSTPVLGRDPAHSCPASDDGPNAATSRCSAGGKP